MNDFKYDISVFGACGHVGLPLSLSFADLGMKVIGIDINKEAIKKIEQKIMPFLEEDAQELLNKAIDSKNFITEFFKQFSLHKKSTNSEFIYHKINLLLRVRHKIIHQNIDIDIQQEDVLDMTLAVYEFIMTLEKIVQDLQK